MRLSESPQLSSSNPSSSSSISQPEFVVSFTGFEGKEEVKEEEVEEKEDVVEVTDAEGFDGVTLDVNVDVVVVLGDVEAGGGVVLIPSFIPPPL